ncbi:carbamoyl-phosphate synthase [Pontibacillus yanchengensis]|uniref:Carbamoyl-phosphate synthase n=1 Tax=Pontibacillus yanchengensis Y32 TaxID=1385514 RepID=A0A0A2TCU7_9BACI|nr:carbamoyl-phosphate synthase [Pontibacillus yanchengensis]KGP73334.1 carbamoyl-phosphate synthase [Pontibacillus yanchengensis Y32]
MNHDHPAVVLDLSANGIGIIRSLARKGIDVYAYDTEGSYRKGKSRLAECDICPNPITEPNKLLHFLVTIAKGLPKKPVLYVGSDDYVSFQSRYREQLRPYFLFLIPEPEMIETLLDKKETYKLAVEHQIPTPKTFFLEDISQLQEVISEIQFPCILKPSHGYQFRTKLNKKAIRVEDAAQLMKDYEYYQSIGEVVIQEEIPGDNRCFYKLATFYGEDMKLLASFTLQKNHQFPAEFGTGAHIESRKVPELYTLGLPFFQKLQLKGIAMAEFKRDPRDGVFKFIEINPRFWLTHSLTGAAAIDFAYLYYLYLTKQKFTATNDFKEGIKWIYLVRYFLTYLEKRKEGKMNFVEFLRGLKGEKVFALLAKDDVMPFVRSSISHLWKAWRKRRKE